MFGNCSQSCFISRWLLVISGKVRKKVIPMDFLRISHHQHHHSEEENHHGCIKTVQEASYKVGACDWNTKMLQNFIYRDFVFIDFNDKLSPLVHLKTHQKNLHCQNQKLHQIPNSTILLMEEILNNHQGYKETCKYWNKLQNINWWTPDFWTINRMVLEYLHFQ